MKYFIIMMFLFSSSFLYAKGVSAGTVIQNSATLNFSIEEEDFSIESNIVTDIVDQLIDVVVSWMDTRAVLVNRGDKERVLTFKIMNSGNGADSFTLSSEMAGEHSDFTVKRTKLYIDSNDNLKLDKNDKCVSSVTLNADETALIFLSSDIDPRESVIEGSQSFVTLKAVSKRGGSGVKGTLHAKRGVGGVDAIDGLGGGVDSKSAIYKLVSVKVILEKMVTKDHSGININRTNENTILTVQIDVSISGEGSILGLNVSDIIPQEVAYINHTLSLDGISLTDKTDGDSGRFETSNNRMSVSFDTLTASNNHTITYKVQVK